MADDPDLITAREFAKAGDSLIAERQVKAVAATKAKWRRVWVSIYFVGYALYVIAAAAWTFPKLPFVDWVIYVVFQLFYAWFWPILLVLNIVGVRW